MEALPDQKQWPYAALLALSLALGVALAAGADAWNDSEEALTAAALLADGAAALVIAVTMALFSRLTGLRLWERAAAPAPGTQDLPQ